MTKSELELAPLRSLDDFLLGSARFQLPNYRDLEKWGNRVALNLLYYQTNYFLMAIILILSVTVLHPLKMFSGALSIVIMYGLFYYFVNANSSATRFKKEHPLIGVILILSGACLVVYLLGSLVVFLFGIFLPISAIFIHASLRLRNIKNKLSNIERVISNKTPMGVLLESLAFHGAFWGPNWACCDSFALCSFINKFVLITTMCSVLGYNRFGSEIGPISLLITFITTWHTDNIQK